MKRKEYVFAAILLANLVFSCNLFATLPIPQGRRIREIVADKYPRGNLIIGATTGEWGFEEPVGEIMDREFSYVTPENDFKHTVIRANRNYWDWSKPDRWIEHIKQNGQVLRIHGPIAPQCATWVREDDRTAEELAAELDTFMTALCQRYNGVEGIEYLDVVNEIALPDGTWHHPKEGTDQWENPWLIIGQDTDVNKTPLYVKQAFEIANEHAPDLKLIINNHCHPGTKGMEKVKETALYLRNLGLRVDGIGWQAHVDVGWETAENLQHLRDVIQWCHDNDLEFHVTEFDAWITNPFFQDVWKQADTYKAIIEVMLQNLPDEGVMGWNAWHITDASGWQPEKLPSLFDTEYKPKPAYYAFQIALEKGGVDTARCDVQFWVNDEKTGLPIEGSEVQFGAETLYTSATGMVIFEDIPLNYYALRVGKEHYTDYTRDLIPIYGDTSRTIYLQGRKYNTSFHLTDNHGEPVSGADVDLDSISGTTNYLGEVDIALEYGTYTYQVDVFGYDNIDGSFTVFSDTVFNLSLIKTHGEVKISIKNDGVPVNNAEVILGEKSRFTNALGNITFDSLMLDATYGYAVSKTGFFEAGGELILRNDTALMVNMRKSLVDIKFDILENGEDVEGATVILNGSDTLISNSQGRAAWYDLPVDQEYTYTVYHGDYVVEDEVWVANDTIISIELIPTKVLDKVHNKALRILPNPVTDHIYLKTDQLFLKVEIIDIGGSAVFKSDDASQNILDVSHLPEGIYFMKVKWRDGSVSLGRFVKM